MNWKILAVIILLNTGFAGYFLYQNSNQDKVTKPIPVQPTIVKKVTVNGLLKVDLVKGLRANMSQLELNNRQLENKVSLLKTDLEWYQQHIKPLIKEHNSTLKASSTVSEFIPGLGSVSKSINSLIQLDKNITYYLNLTGESQGKNSVLHQNIEQFIKDGKPEMLPIIKKEIEEYKKQTHNLTKKLEKISPALSTVKDIIGQSEKYSKIITESIIEIFSDKPKNEQAPKVENIKATFEEQFNRVHLEIKAVNTLLKHNYQLTDEINMYVFILDKYQTKLAL